MDAAYRAVDRGRSWPASRRFGPSALVLSCVACQSPSTSEARAASPPASEAVNEPPARGVAVSDRPLPRANPVVVLGFETDVERFCNAKLDTRTVAMHHVSSYLDGTHLLADQLGGGWFSPPPAGEDEARAWLCPRGCESGAATPFDWGPGTGLIVVSDGDLWLLPLFAGTDNGRCPGQTLVYARRQGHLIHASGRWEALESLEGPPTDCEDGPIYERDIIIEVRSGEIELDVVRDADTIIVELEDDHVSLRGCGETLRLGWVEARPSDGSDDVGREPETVETSHTQGE